MKPMFMVHEPEPEIVISDPLLPHTWRQAVLALTLIVSATGFFWLCWGGA
ncbi:hypothetical protein [Nocardia wallacei]|nr:hypothetical protein [Nocardia wallacei]